MHEKREPSTPEHARLLRLLEVDPELRADHDSDPREFECDFLEFADTVLDPGSAEEDRCAFLQFRELFS